MDFYQVLKSPLTSNNRKADFIVRPDFVFANVRDLVCKGGDMYAFWADDKWNQNVDDLIVTVDNDIRNVGEEVKQKNPGKDVTLKLMNEYQSGLMLDFNKFTNNMKQSDIAFNSRIIFADEKPVREDYATSQLKYTPEEGPTPAFDELIGLLYSKDEINKILWFMGALLSNKMPRIQKFMYLYGGKGSGKGTVIKIFKLLFEGYYATIDLMHLTSGSEFATAQVREVPLLIDDDSDMSRIVKDTNLLKLTAHEPISVNVKYKSTYDVIFNGLVITASNQRFKVRNIDSGITRRAVVVSPTNYTHDSANYVKLMELVKYELPMIADKAMNHFDVAGEYYYENYMDLDMAEATDHIFSFVREHYAQLGDVVTLKQASELYKVFLDGIGYDTKGYKRKIKQELSRYYRNFYDQRKVEGMNIRNVFEGLKTELLFPKADTVVPATVDKDDFGMIVTDSIFDSVAADYQAQIANKHGVPSVPWDDCKTTLSMLDTRSLHYVRVPMNHIVIDFDKVDADGNKDLEQNLIASQKFPPTYTELSKSGKGVHLHYYYDGDVGQLAKLYEDDVEIKVFTGKQSLRRLLTKCNNLPITHITTGLPQKDKEGVKVYQDVEIITWNEKKMRTAIQGNLHKKYHNATKPSLDFIVHIFENAEKEGIKYDLRDMRQDIMVFASSSTNNAPYCIKTANKINYCTIDEVTDAKKLQTGTIIVPDEDITFYDCEVFPNLFVVVFKDHGKPELTEWINPTPTQMEWLCKKNLIGFNNRRYDNHILYARLLGEDLLSLYRQSQRIVNGQGPSGMYSAAYEMSYADIYEYSSKKQGLKKWEIELGIKHDEFELPWDQPVPEDKWDRVVEYCGYDVLATEATFDATYYDYTARKILATLSGLKMNATTTQHAAAFLFGDDPRPQDKFIYTDLSEKFPGYSYSFGKSEYRDEDPGEGGYVYSEPGVYEEVVLLDAASMHPTSLIEMNYFGPYTQRYADLKQTRIYIKHNDFESAKQMFGGMLEPYLHDEETAKQLSFALKIIINIVYGMTSAKFDNKFKHPMNLDNIVAKRGALFMIDLKHAVQQQGFNVAHIKTDSIKIPNATPQIIDFVFKFGEKYGYDFEHEETYSRLALVNKAVYVAEYLDEKENKMVWAAVGAQFAEPYVFKKLFSHEDILEKDFIVTKQATAPIYIGETFVGKVAQVYASVSGEEMFRVAEDKKGYVSGTKGFLWKMVDGYPGKEDLDMRYYDGLVDAAIESIKKVGSVAAIIDPFKKRIPCEVLSEDDLPF